MVCAWAAHWHPLVQRDVISSLHQKMNLLNSALALGRTASSLGRACAQPCGSFTKREVQYGCAFIHSLNKYVCWVYQVPGAGAAAGRVCRALTAGKALAVTSPSRHGSRGRNRVLEAWWGRHSPLESWIVVRGSLGCRTTLENSVLISLEIFQHLAHCQSPTSMWQLKNTTNFPRWSLHCYKHQETVSLSFSVSLLQGYGLKMLPQSRGSSVYCARPMYRLFEK